VRILVAIVVRALYFLPALLLVFSGRRLIKLTHPERIGHLAVEMDCLLKEVRLGLLPPRIGILLAPDDRVANRALVDYWATHVTVVRSPWLCRLLEPMYRFRFARFRQDMTTYAVAINATAELVGINRQWGERPPLLVLNERDLARGREALQTLGVEAGARFVCFHNREGGYSPGDEHLHDYRNNGIETYFSAMESLTARGIYCIRMGDPSMRVLPKMERVIDYAHSDLRADWLDLYLCARCDFFVGSSSGLFLVANAFGVPSCLTNLVPFSLATGAGPQRDIGIPKLLWSEREQRLLAFREILDSPVADFRFSELYEAHGIRTLENTPEDVRDVVLEMLGRAERTVSYTQEDEALQGRFKAMLRPGHHGYGGASRIGRDFLRKYANLLGDSSG
jgi:putative glycosyltransferase (TIGR04372 family)